MNNGGEKGDQALLRARFWGDPARVSLVLGEECQHDERATRVDVLGSATRRQSQGSQRNRELQWLPRRPIRRQRRQSIGVPLDQFWTSAADSLIFKFSCATRRRQIVEHRPRSQRSLCQLCHSLQALSWKIFTAAATVCGTVLEQEGARLTAANCSQLTSSAIGRADQG